MTMKTENKQFSSGYALDPQLGKSMAERPTLAGTDGHATRPS